MAQFSAVASMKYAAHEEAGYLKSGVSTQITSQEVLSCRIKIPINKVIKANRISGASNSRADNNRTSLGNRATTPTSRGSRTTTPTSRDSRATTLTNKGKVMIPINKGRVMIPTSRGNRATILTNKGRVMTLTSRDNRIMTLTNSRTRADSRAMTPTSKGSSKIRVGNLVERDSRHSNKLTRR